MLGPLERRRIRNARGASERGSMSLEYAILFPAVILIIFVVIQGALYFYARDVARHAAESAAHAASALDAGPGAGEAAASAVFAQTGGSLIGPSVAVVSDGDYVTATVTGSAPTVVALFDLGVTQSARSPIEDWVAPGGTP